MKLSSLSLYVHGETQCFRQELFPKWLRYICIYGKERNKSLFQKEAMWNMAARFTTASKLLFLDSDVSPIDTLHYFRDMKAAICRGKVIHACYKLIQERYEDKYLGEMYSVLAKREKPEGHYLFPRHRLRHHTRRLSQERRLSAILNTRVRRCDLLLGKLPRHQAADGERKTLSPEPHKKMP